MQVLSEGLTRHGITIDMAVEEGIGIAFISELAAARGLALGRVKKVEVEGLDLRRTIYLAHNVRHPLTRAQERFWTFVVDRREVFADEIRRLADNLRLNPEQ